MFKKLIGIFLSLAVLASLMISIPVMATDPNVIVDETFSSVMPSIITPIVAGDGAVVVENGALKLTNGSGSSNNSGFNLTLANIIGKDQAAVLDIEYDCKFAARNVNGDPSARYIPRIMNQWSGAILNMSADTWLKVSDGSVDGSDTYNGQHQVNYLLRNTNTPVYNKYKISLNFKDLTYSVSVDGVKLEGHSTSSIPGKSDFGFIPYTDANIYPRHAVQKITITGTAGIAVEQYIDNIKITKRPYYSYQSMSVSGARKPLINVTMSEAMDAISLQTVQLKDGTTVIDTTKSQVGSKITLVPTQNLKQGTNYTVFIPDTVKSASGVPLSAAVSQSFSSWIKPVAMTTVSYDFSGATIPSEFYVWGNKTSIVDGAICIDTALQTEYTSWDGFKYNFPVGVNKSNTEKVIVEYDFKVPRTAGTSLAAGAGGTSGINYLGGLLHSGGRIASFDTSANAFHLQAWVNNSTLSGSLYNFGTQADPSQYIRLRTEYNFANNTYRSYKDGQLLKNTNGVADFAMVADKTAVEVRFATPYPMKTLYIDNLTISTLPAYSIKGFDVLASDNTSAFDFKVGDMITAKATILNNTPNTENVYLALVGYNTDNKIVTAAYNPVALAQKLDGNWEITAGITAINGCTKIKAFLWNTTANMKPLEETIEIGLAR